MGQIVRDQYPPTPIPWGENPKVNFDSQSTPITCFRGLLKALSSATRALFMNYIANARHAHNPKVEGSNPSPATNSLLFSIVFIARFRSTGYLRLQGPRTAPRSQAISTCREGQAVLRFVQVDRITSRPQPGPAGASLQHGVLDYLRPCRPKFIASCPFGKSEAGTRQLPHCHFKHPDGPDGSQNAA